MELRELTAFLGKLRVPHSTESEMQEQIARAMAEFGVPFVREHELGKNSRIDFMVGRIGIECKVKGQPLAIHRQLERYLLSDQLDAIVLVTSRFMGTTGTSNGKPIVVVQVGKAWL